jgi:hypothetical protein
MIDGLSKVKRDYVYFVGGRYVLWSRILDLKWGRSFNLLHRVYPVK